MNDLVLTYLNFLGSSGVVVSIDNDLSLAREVLEYYPYTEEFGFSVTITYDQYKTNSMVPLTLTILMIH